MQPILLCTVLLCISLYNYGQQVTATVQPVRERPSLQNMVKTATGFIAYEVDRNMKGMKPSAKFSKLTYTAMLIKYDQNMQVATMNNLTDGDHIYGLYPPEVRVINDKAYLIFYQAVEGEEAVWVKAATIDDATLQLSPAVTLMKFSQEDVNLMKVMRHLDGNAFRLVTSPDKTKLLFVRSSGTSNDFTFAVTDQNLKVLWGKDNKMDHISPDVVVTSSCVDNKGVVYSGYKIETHKTPIQGHVLINSSDGKEKDLKITDDELYQVSVLADAKNPELVHVTGNCFGGTQYISAVYYASINTATQVLSNYKRTDFDEKLIDLFAQNKLAFTKDHKFGLYPFHLEVFQLEDGTIDMAGDIGRVNRKDHTDVAGHSVSDDEYIYGSIMNVRFTNGNAQFTRVARDRKSDDPIGCGVFYLPFKNNVVLFYSDDARNVNTASDGKAYDSDNYRNLVLMSASIAPDGTVTKKVVIDKSDDHFLPLPLEAKRLSAGNFSLPLRKITKRGRSDEYVWGDVKVE